jgi:hypothetical protein
MGDVVRLTVDVLRQPLTEHGGRARRVEEKPSLD